LLKKESAPKEFLATALPKQEACWALSVPQAPRALAAAVPTKSDLAAEKAPDEPELQIPAFPELLEPRALPEPQVPPEHERRAARAVAERARAAPLSVARAGPKDDAPPEAAQSGPAQQDDGPPAHAATESPAR
jgi:hypothetical protein